MSIPDRRVDVQGRAAERERTRSNRLRAGSLAVSRRTLLLGSFALQLLALIAIIGAAAFGLRTAVAVVAVCSAGVGVALAGLVISRQWSAEEQRCRSAEATIKLARSVLIAVDPDGRIQMANPAACAVLGRPEADVIGQPLHDQLVADASAGASGETFARLLRGEAGVTEPIATRTVLRPDGAERRVTCHVAARYDRDGQLRGLLVSGEDVTALAARDAAARMEHADLAQLRRLAQDVAASDDARGPIVTRIRTMLGADFVALAERNGDGFEYTTSTLTPLAGHTVGPGAQSGCLVVADTRAPMSVDGALHCKTVDPKLRELTRSVAMRYEPVLARDGVIAVIVAGWATSQPRVSARHSQLLALAADETALALNRANTVRKLERLAHTDTLTGVANRRAFDAELGRAIARAERDGRPLSLVVLDLNEFKALNDRAGHRAGDLLLVECVNAWSSQLRAGDLLARLGGDEFAAVLFDCGGSEARVVGRRLATATPHQPGAGVGVATWNRHSAHELYQLADRALYRDKAERRERRIADGPRVTAVERSPAWSGAVPESVHQIASEAGELLGLPGIYVDLVGDGEVRQLVRPPKSDALPPHATDDCCRHVVVSGRPLLVSDALEEQSVVDPPATQKVRSYAAIPLMDGSGNVLGALCATDTDPRQWEAHEVLILDKLALRIAAELAPSAAPLSQ